MKFDFDGLQAFVTVAELGAFNKAAERLSITQVALTRRIQKLEQHLGLKLIDRTTRSLSLTPVGRGLLPKAQGLVQDMANTFRQLREVASTGKGHFTLACIPTLTNEVLPPLIRQYRDRHPDNGIRMVDASAHEIRAAILGQQAELGLSVQGSRHPELDETVLFDDPLMLYCRREHPLSQRPSVTWSDMRLDDLIVVSSFTDTRIVMNYQLAQKGIELSGHYEVQHHATALSLVMAGVGCAIMPASTHTGSERSGVVRVPLKSPVVRRKVVLVRKRGITLSPAAQGFEQLLRKAFRVRHDA